MAIDLCRPLKLECPAEGGTQLDMGPTELNPLQDGIPLAAAYLQNISSTTVDKTCFIDRTGNALRFTDATTTHVLSEMVSSVSGEVGSHNSLVDPIHFLADGPGDGWASGAVTSEVYTGPLLTARTWYTDSTQVKKIVSWSWTYSGPLVQTLKMALYAADGSTLVKTVTDAYTYNGPLVASRTRTFGTS